MKISKQIIFFTSLGMCLHALGQTTLNASIGVEGLVDDQFDLTSEGSDVQSVTYRPNVRLTYEGRRYESELSALYAATQFVGDDAMFSDFGILNAGWDQSYEGQRSDFGLSINFRESLAANTLELNDNALTQENDIVRSFRFNPTASWSTGPRTNLDLAYSYQRSRTESDDGTDELRADNDFHRLSFGWRKDVSQRSALTLTGRFLAFRPRETEFTGQTQVDADVFSGSVGGNFFLSERWSMAGSVGLEQLNRDSGDLGPGESVEDGDIVFFADWAIERTGQHTDVGFGLSAGTVQQIDGGVDEQQSINFTLESGLSRSLTLDIDLQHLIAQQRSRGLTEFDAILRWQFANNWRSSLAYQFRNQEADESLFLDSLDGQSNRVFLRLTYVFNDLRF